MSLLYPQLELWSDEELDWIEVPDECLDLLTDICCRAKGDLPLTLCWRTSTGERFPFSRAKWLAKQRRVLKESGTIL